MKFNFSIRTAIKESWAIFLQAPWFFVTLSLLMALFNFVGGEDTPSVFVFLAVIASIILAYVWLSVVLAAVDGKTDMLQFSQLRTHLPSWRGLAFFIIIGIVAGLFKILGFIALIIPGIYIMTRLMFVNIAFVDRKGGVMQTLRYSWHMVKGDAFWTAFLTGIVSFGLVILGILLLGVGFLVLYPISKLLIAKLYRALSLHHEEQSLIVQPEELAAPTKPELTPVTE